MSDISTKILQDIPLKQRGQEPVEPPSGVLAPETAEKERQKVADTSESGLQSDTGRKGQGESHTYTVMITDKRSGESRVISLNAASPESAKSAASAGLGEGEEVLSVSESSVQTPDPKRGLTA